MYLMRSARIAFISLCISYCIHYHLSKGRDTMAEKLVLLTAEGKQALEDELNYLKSEKRKEISEKIKVALGFGDLSENSEYDEAKNEQAQVESRIVELEAMLKHASIIDESELDTDVVRIGAKVKLLDIEFEDEVEYQIVGSTEANPAKGSISDESPVGKAVLGHHINDVVDVETPGGIVKFKIVSISR